MQFSVAEGRSWLPAMEPTVRLYIAPQMSKAAIKAAIFPPSTAPTRTWGLPQAVKGMSSLQVREPGEQELEHMMRTWLPVSGGGEPCAALAALGASA
ncbi:hypothetical protein CYMTET_50924 [Cymbomonas tetramitiformis]|uniref:Uncharacterized protein n=1 Tax=Cymbomonas tetramitiformis TaxID=36881 RepID=A0AAE0ESY0_9CHLO|nr:hypothetical protein CYMTET_50924 [Cymbomonas tetramitiformis]